MEDLVYASGNIVLGANTLYFLGEQLNYNMLENASVNILPRRSLFAGLKIWLYGLLIMIVIWLIWHKYSFLGDIYIYTIFPLAVFNIICFLQKYYLVTVRTKSGKEYYYKSKNKVLLEEISYRINSKIEEVNISKDQNIIVNTGIINKGNNNVNKIKNIKTKEGKKCS